MKETKEMKEPKEAKKTAKPSEGSKDKEKAIELAMGQIEKQFG